MYVCRAVAACSLQRVAAVLEEVSCPPIWTMLVTSCHSICSAPTPQSHKQTWQSTDTAVSQTCKHDSGWVYIRETKRLKLSCFLCVEDCLNMSPYANLNQALTSCTFIKGNSKDDSLFLSKHKSLEAVLHKCWQPMYYKGIISCKLSVNGSHIVNRIEDLASTFKATESHRKS